MDVHDALLWSTSLAAGAVGLTSLETLASLRDYGRGGVFDRAMNPVSPRLHRLGERLSIAVPSITVRGVGVMAVARAGAAVTLCVASAPAALLAGAAVAIILLGVVQERLNSDHAGFGEQMVKVILGGATLGWLGGTDTTLRWAVWFIAAQAALAYCAAGAFKAISPTWRSGEALWIILRLEDLGHPPAGRWLSQRVQLSKMLSWATIVWEVTFPLALIAPPWALWVWLGAGVLFHLGCSSLMGLNSFLWSFVATYPAVVFTNESIRTWLGMSG